MTNTGEPDVRIVGWSPRYASVASVNAEVPNEAPNWLRAMRADKMWKFTQGEGVVVAVLDTGCDTEHFELKDRIIGGRNFTDEYSRNYYEDGHGHGTHVAGIIAAERNGIGIAGVAPKAKLLICKVLNDNGGGLWPWIVEAIDYCCNWQGPNGERVNIINMSLGGPEYDKDVHEAIKRAIEHHILVVCAAGNEGDGKIDTEQVSYPAMLPEVVSVGAVDIDRNIAYFSNTNDEVDVAAPGVAVYSTRAGGGYLHMTGTSMATPAASGFAALLVSKHRALFKGFFPTENLLYTMLKMNTVDIGPAGVDAATGAGFLTFAPPMDIDIELTMGQREYLVNGRKAVMDAPPFMKEGRTYVPIRFMAEAAGAKVDWDSKQPDKAFIRYI